MMYFCPHRRFLSLQSMFDPDETAALCSISSGSSQFAKTHYTDFPFKRADTLQNSFKTRV